MPTRACQLQNPFDGLTGARFVGKSLSAPSTAPKLMILLGKVNRNLLSNELGSSLSQAKSDLPQAIEKRVLMRQSGLIAVVALVVVGVIAVAAASSQTDEQAIRKAEADFQAARAAKGLEGWLSFF